MHLIRLPYTFLLITLLAVIMLASCAARSVSLLPENIAPSVLLPTAQGGIIDGRGRFREIFKHVLSAQCPKLPAGAPCDDGHFLWKLPGESPPTGKATPSWPSKGAFRVVIVPGFLAQCVAEESMVFSDARERLEQMGYKTD